MARQLVAISVSLFSKPLFCFLYGRCCIGCLIPVTKTSTGFHSARWKPGIIFNLAGGQYNPYTTPRLDKLTSFTSEVQLLMIIKCINFSQRPAAALAFHYTMRYS